MKQDPPLCSEIFFAKSEESDTRTYVLAWVREIYEIYPLFHWATTSYTVGPRAWDPVPACTYTHIIGFFEETLRTHSRPVQADFSIRGGRPRSI